jgi:hypothetical protein
VNVGYEELVGVVDVVVDRAVMVAGEVVDEADVGVGAGLDGEGLPVVVELGDTWRSILSPPRSSSICLVRM